ncbi:MAG: lamin tail domain-containing protein [Candidatus Kerfeldbacteria bacterium]|nr:lamin tail domain-containing protein [Candidatus Kerfeldbacteria bacterium]
MAGETSTATGLVLTEFIPNPRGSDDNEWLELYNSTASAISTSGWKLIINNRTISLPLKEIPAEDYLVLAKAEGKFTLLNQGGSLTLEAPSGRRETLIEYGQAQEGASFALADDGWHWTNTPTPGNENIILENGTNDDYQSVVISELKTLDSGSRIKTEGMVSAAPGLMGEKLIFLSGSGIQVLLNNSLWPRIEPGDRLYVSGTLSRNSIGSKLVMRKNDTLKIIGHGTPPPPVTTNLTEVSEEHEAELITVTGRVSQSSNTYFTLSDGTESLRVLLRKQPEIKWPQVTVGMEATVTGFVTLNKSGPRLAARLPDDILLKSGAASAPETIDLSQAEPTNWPGYLLLTLLALILGGAYLWEHYHLPAPVELIKKYLRK